MKIFRQIPLQFSLSILFVLIASCSFAQLQFIENKGQWDKAVDYKSDISNGAFFLQQHGFTVLMHSEKDMQIFSEYVHGHDSTGQGSVAGTEDSKITIHSHAYRVNFLGASGLVQAMPDKVLPTYNNYFLGNDKSKWQGNCKIYQAVTYKDMYPNIDVRYYTDQGTLKYDIIVHPGGNINDIALQYEGADKLSIRNKELIVGTSVGEVKELYPYTYQSAKEGRQVLDCRYALDKNIVRFKIKDYDPSATIIIDPTLIFCTFTGSRTDNWGYTATPGPDGSFFAGGISFDTGFPVSVGAFDESFNKGIDEDHNGWYDIAIIKLSSDGSTRLYATYLGGDGNEQPHSLICDAAGNLVVAGRTNSSDYPLVGNAMYGPGGAYDIIITKFNAAGSALLGSVKIGGAQDDGVNIKPKYIPVYDAFQGAYDTRRNYGDDARSEVILDGSNNIYLASCTQSDAFPVRNTSIQTTFAGSQVAIKQDGVILKFDANLSNLLFSTFFGGTGNDACFVLSINPLTGNLYVAGGTTSKNLPGDTTGVMYPTYQGGYTDGFITILKPDGSSIIKTTYIGTHDNDAVKDGNDLVYGIQFDKLGFPYIMGTTASVGTSVIGDWKAFNAGFSNAGGKQFIGKLKPDLSGYIYTTMFGNNSTIPNISPVAFLVDRCQNVYVSGWGGKFNNDRGYPCAGTAGLNFLATSGAIKSSTDGNDFFFFVLEKNATNQLYGTFFGQNGGFNDHVDGGTSRFDANGIIYQAMCANCGNTPGVFFPTTAGVWASVNGSVNCNEAAVKIEMNFSGIGASVKATIKGVFDTIGCVPLTIKFIDTIAKGKKYIWDYGDNSRKDTTLAPNNSVSHTYVAVGSYKITLVSIDSVTCNVADTATITVKVGNNQVNPNFIAAKTGGCQSLTFQFTNTTTAGRPAYTSNSFLWDFGDNTPPLRAGFTNVSHTYAAPGTYQVRLIVDDTVFCNAPDTAEKTVRLATNVVSRFSTPQTGCQPYLAQFTNTSLGGTDWLWDFGDNTTSTLYSPPPHLYPNVGTYIVTLSSFDTSTCNKRSDTAFTVTVIQGPISNFQYLPNPTENNKPVNFTNLSARATSYRWDFGDGETSAEKDPSHLFNSADTFNVCLRAINEVGCEDTFCLPVIAKITPLLDVPNAFTPGRFGENGIVSVMGFGIGKMDWKIYNRWGQLVFSSASRKQGWDGTFKGVLQPMDVYTYTLDVEFTDGKKLRKTGDITLLR